MNYFAWWDFLGLEALLGIQPSSVPVELEGYDKQLVPTRCSGFLDLGQFSETTILLTSELLSFSEVEGRLTGPSVFEVSVVQYQCVFPCLTSLFSFPNKGPWKLQQVYWIDLVLECGEKLFAYSHCWQERNRAIWFRPAVTLQSPSLSGNYKGKIKADASLRLSNVPDYLGGWVGGWFFERAFLNPSPRASADTSPEKRQRFVWVVAASLDVRHRPWQGCAVTDNCRWALSGWFV